MSDPKKAVEDLIEKAVAADDSNDALKFSQAATNSANALCAMKSIESKENTA